MSLIMLSPYGNYVVQKALQIVDDSSIEKLANTVF